MRARELDPTSVPPPCHRRVTIFTPLSRRRYTTPVNRCEIFWRESHSRREDIRTPARSILARAFGHSLCRKRLKCLEKVKRLVNLWEDISGGAVSWPLSIPRPLAHSTALPPRTRASLLRRPWSSHEQSSRSQPEAEKYDLGDPDEDDGDTLTVRV